jgi:hypothetical protein
MPKDKKEEKKTTTPKELVKYELAALAANLNQGDKDRRELAGFALRKFYEGCGVDKDDPIIGYAIQTGGIAGALQVYSGKYAAALVKMKLKDYVAYVGEKGYKLPESASKTSALISKYAEMTIEDIKKDKETNEELAVIDMIIFSNLQRQVLEGNLYGKLMKAVTDNNLQGLEAKLNEAEAA